MMGEIVSIIAKAKRQREISELSEAEKRDLTDILRISSLISEIDWLIQEGKIPSGMTAAYMNDLRKLTSKARTSLHKLIERVNQAPKF
jgi:ribonuclease HII